MLHDDIFCIKYIINKSWSSKFYLKERLDEQKWNKVGFSALLKPELMEIKLGQSVEF